MMSCRPNARYAGVNMPLRQFVDAAHVDLRTITAPGA